MEGVGSQLAGQILSLDPSGQEAARTRGARVAAHRQRGDGGAGIVVDAGRRGHVRGTPLVGAQPVATDADHGYRRCWPRWESSLWPWQCLGWSAACSLTWRTGKKSSRSGWRSAPRHGSCAGRSCWRAPPVRAGVSVGVLASWGMLKVAESQRILPPGSIAGDASPYIVIAVALVAVALATLLALSSHVGRRDPVAMLRVE